MAEQPSRSARFLQAWRAIIGEATYQQRRAAIQNPNAIDPDTLEDNDICTLRLGFNLPGPVMAAILRGEDVEEGRTPIGDIIRAMFGDPVFVQPPDSPPGPLDDVGVATDDTSLVRPRYGDYSNSRDYQHDLQRWRQRMIMLGFNPNDIR